MAVPVRPAALPTEQLIRFQLPGIFLLFFFFLIQRWGRRSCSFFDRNLISYSGKVLGGISVICSLFKVTGQEREGCGVEV